MKMSNMDSLIQKAADKDVSDIQKQIEEIVSDLDGFTDLQAEIKLLKGLSDYFSQAGIFTGTENTFKLMKVIGNLHAQIDVIEDKLLLLTNKRLSNTTSTALNAAKSFLKSLSSHLWQMLSQSMNFKEWSVQGGASIPNLFGLSGNIQVQFVFGT